MKLLITGGTGFIGAPLCRMLAQQGHELLILTRRPDQQPARAGLRFVPWDGSEWQRAIADVAGIINLAGEPIVAKRWSAEQKAAMWESRVQTTRTLVNAVAAHERKPVVLLNASAIGYYGPRADEKLDETDPPGRGFLAELCQAWEAEARRAEPLGLRVVRLRIGVVLGAGGGALSKMVPPFRYCIGGPLGSGRQWVSWVHRDDVLGLIAWILARPDVSGAVNATAPQPVTMRELCSTLGRVMDRPSWAPVPGFILTLLLGEMADALLTGQRVLPTAATMAGYTFQHSGLADALKACLW